MDDRFEWGVVGSKWDELGVKDGLGSLEDDGIGRGKFGRSEIEGLG